MKERLEILRKAAASEAPVLIYGESGAGKDMFAAEVHRLSPRSAGPYIVVSCAGVVDSLAESELFGHVSGAFTGAEGERQGRFEAARGGTLVLDEIADASAAVQAKLLRVLEERRFERVGSNETVEADVRVVATTSRNLGALAASGEFREDLYYRLAVLQLEVPPLRERREDILPLALTFLGEGRAFTTEAEAALLAWRWPGNVRELANRVESAGLLRAASGEAVSEAAMFPERAAEDSVCGDGLREAIEVFKKRHITRVLESKEWKVSEAAKALGIERTYLHRLIRELCLPGFPAGENQVKGF